MNADELAAQALARVFLDAQHDSDAGIPARVAIRARVLELKDDEPDVYDLIVRHATQQLLTTLAVADAEA